MSILTFYKPKYIFQILGKSTKIPNQFNNAYFFLIIIKRILYGILTLELMQNIMIIIKINYILLWLRE